ncbi:MAG: ribosome silencing factor [Thermoleophilia bacterium]
MEDLARRAAAIAASKKAADIVILDMRELCSYTDFFIICSGRSGRQVHAIGDEIRYQLKREGVLPLRVEGEHQSEWFLLDYPGVFVHVFTPETRDFYRLENLWKDAPRTEVASE